MKLEVVVDVGNTRMKWGLCRAGRVESSISLPHAVPDRWQDQLSRWELAAAGQWAVSSVQPEHCKEISTWLQAQGQRVVLINEPEQLDLAVPLERPDWVGIDRLLNGLACKCQGKLPAVIIDAGSAVTVDWLDDAGAFRGGAIFPGVRFMTRSLHEYTALLPRIRIDSANPPLPGPSTPTAMQAGIYYAVTGGIQRLIHKYEQQANQPAHVYLTGGDAALLQPGLAGDITLWQDMTLEGIRLAAEALP